MSKLTKIGLPPGGNTGQVLKKKTGTNYDVEWGTGGGGSGTVTSVSTTAPITGGTITTTGTIGITQATASTDGYLSSTDWNTFNNKQSSLTNPVTGTGTTGQVAYFNGTSSITGESNLFWDATNDRLGIGLNNPAFDFEISKSVSYPTNSGAVAARVINTSPTGQATIAIRNDNSAGALEIFGSSWANSALQNKVTFTSLTSAGFDIVLYNNSTSANFSIKHSTATTEKLRLFGSTGNLVIQNGGSFTDSGFRLDVNGTARIQGNLNISTGGATITGVTTSTNDFPTFRAFSSSASANTGYQMWVNNGSGNNASFLAYGNSTGGGLGGNAGFGSSTSIVIYGSSAIADGQTTTIKLRPGGYNTTADALVAYKNSVSIGTTNTPAASAALDVVSTTGGFLPPRMTTTQRDAITSPATGLIVYDTTNNVNSVYNATAWQNFVTTSNFDGLNISFGTTTGTKIGTATTQKIGFFNATPVVQPSAVTTAQGIADALSSLGLLASSSITTIPDVGGKLYLFNSY